MGARPNSHGKGRANYLLKGENNVECDRTGFKVKSGDVKQEWNHFMVRLESWEQRQPQDLLRGFPDNQSPQVSRPGTGDFFLDVGDVKPGDL